MTQFAAGFKENNHATTLAGLLAEKISWDWSTPKVMALQMT